MSTNAVATDPATLIAFQDSARDFLKQMAPRSRLRRLRNTRPGFERAVWRKMAQAGWCGMLVPESLGGLDLGLSAVAVIAEEIGRNLLSEPFVGGAVQVSALLSALPASEQRDALSTQIAAGDALIGLAWQTANKDRKSALTLSRGDRDDGHVLLSGEAHWVYPGVADGWIVAARQSVKDGARTACDDIDALIFVPADTVGLQTQVHDRVDGSQSGSLQFNGAPVPQAFLLAEGDTARHALRHAIASTRVAQAAELLGIARQSFDTTRDYLITRVQFGKSIGANQALQHRMVDALLQIELADAVLRAVLSGDQAPSNAFNAGCARAKARCAQAALHMTRMSIQFHGAIGYTDELDIGLYLKRTLHLCGWLGGVRENQRAALPVPHVASNDCGATSLNTNASPSLRKADWNAMPEDEFRAQVRAFIHAHYPQSLRNPPRRLHWNEIKSWYLELSSQGWIAPAWPREYGGMALAPDKLIAFIEEMEDYGVARMPDQGLINIGPVLMRYGTPDQRKRYLPRILAGDDVWCQGYSEPNAGSDLASLRTEAIIDGDHFVVNGQKIWTTLAQDATHIFMLVRTDCTVKKQAGISFLLVDLASSGITVKPIRNIGDEEEFCEVFFDDVSVPLENLVGELNQGWTIAKALLDFERIFVGSPSQAKYALNQLRLVGRDTGGMDDRGFMDGYIAFALDVADLQALYTDFADMVKRGEPLPASVSLLKIFATETYSRICMAVVEAAQDRGGDAEAFVVEGTLIAPANRLYNSAITTIYGGTNEIQRNILAKVVIGLPN